MRKFISLLFIFTLIISAFSICASALEMTDGTYEVNIALWHSEDDKESMAADSVGTKATIVVENGVKTMHITSGEMSMMGIKASLQELRIADANGNYTDAKVEFKNAEGNPTGFYFTMPHTNEYITVKVNPHLAIMGNKDIGARIKVDYSTLKLVKSAVTVTQTDSETMSIQSNADAESVTEAVIVTESVTVEDSENIANEITTVITAAETTADIQTESPKQSNPAIIIVAAAVAVIVISVFVKIKRK